MRVGDSHGSQTRGQSVLAFFLLGPTVSQASLGRSQGHQPPLSLSHTSGFQVEILFPGDDQVHACVIYRMNLEQSRGRSETQKNPTWVASTHPPTFLSSAGAGHWSLLLKEDASPYHLTNASADEEGKPCNWLQGITPRFRSKKQIIQFSLGSFIRIERASLVWLVCV